MKGDRIEIITSDGNGPFVMTAEKNGAGVEWELEKDGGIQWVTIRQVSKANKIVRTMKFKTDVVSSVVETPFKPV